MKRTLLLYSILSLLQYHSFAQNRTIDSIRVLLKDGERSCPSPCADTLHIVRLNAISWECIRVGESDSVLHYGNIVLNTFQSSPALEKTYSKGKSIAFNNLGLAYSGKGNYPVALDFFFKALKIGEDIKDQNIIAITLSNIGILYRNQAEYDKALDYYLKALKINEQLSNKSRIAINLGNIGIVYKRQGNNAKALEYYFKALKLDEELKNKNGIARHLGNIAIIYELQEDYQGALEFYTKALKMSEELGDQSAVAANLGNIGSLYTTQKKYDKAEQYLLKAIAITEEKGILDYKKGLEETISRLYLEQGNYKKAYEHYVEYTIAKDSIFNKQKHDDMTRKALSYEFEKKELVLKVQQEKKDELLQAELKQQTTQRNGFIAGFALMLALAAVIYGSYRNKRKAHEIISVQKAEVEQQKHIIEEKNKDITDSINYARRLQQAILPSERSFNEHLKDSFILYKPKDIVAGDFYWLEKRGDIVFIAAADCTGHGVPGAMVSVVCSNALNRAVKEFGLTGPASILNKVRDLVIETFEKSEREVKDGMDISLCAINTVTNEAAWAGANNPLWYVRENEMNEVKPDKQPIGKHDSPRPFTAHSLVLRKGDIIYLFTDGYADQFGGDKGKKFKYSQLRELLLSIAYKPVNEQKKILDEAFETWRGGLEQVDDVCLIGVRV